MPATLSLVLELGDAPNTRYVRLPVDMWNLGPRFVYRHRGPERVVGVTLDPASELPDADRVTNRWAR